MNTPSEEALEASEAVQDYLGFPRRATIDIAAIIDRHFEQLRRDNATLAGRLTAAELERDGLGARAEQAEARVKELEEQRNAAEVSRNVANASLLKAEQRNDELAEALREIATYDTQRAAVNGCAYAMISIAVNILARHADGEPAKLMMRDDPRYKGTSYGEPAKHPDTEATS